MLKASDLIEIAQRSDLAPGEWRELALSAGKAGGLTAGQLQVIGMMFDYAAPAPALGSVQRPPGHDDVTQDSPLPPLTGKTVTDDQIRVELLQPAFAADDVNSITQCNIALGLTSDKGIRTTQELCRAACAAEINAKRAATKRSK